MTRLSDFNIRKIVLILAILSGPVVSLFSQREISGIINTYRKVVTIGPESNSVTLSSAVGISPTDTVLLMQMQGVRINTEDGNYGYIVANKFGTLGGYEFLLVSNVTGNKVYFSRNMQNLFDVRGNVQLIRVPSYNSAIVKGPLTAMAWDPVSGTGGVLAMIVRSKLELDKTNGVIDVAGKGFLGGKDEVGIGDCVESNPNYFHDSFNSTWNNAGNKGEGVAIHDNPGNLLYPMYVKGPGPNFTGGGGGNGKYAGGGGGANRGFGYGGASEKTGSGGCPIPGDGARGGSTDVNVPFADGVYLGGGGGASTHASGQPQSDGGNGGGIVIIMADEISGNSRTINAAGASANNISGNGGAGGGGAGGSVLLSLRNFSGSGSDSIKISVRGGNGGVHLPGGWGSGGGGGGGLISISLASLPGKVNADTLYGNPNDVDYGSGNLKFRLVPKINGFLFNAIRSEVTGNNKDSICSNVPFGKIIGTNPIGGELPYTIKWRKSTASESGPWEDIPGATGLDYTPGTLSATTWFQRLVKDSSIPEKPADESIPVEVIVHQAITGNIVGKDTIICYGQNPLPLVPLNSGPSDGHSPFYNYKWLQNTSNVAVWDTTMSATGSAIRNPAYDPPALNDTTYYKRFITSGRCIDFSSTVKITVLPSIQDNIIFNKDTAVCQPYPFDNLRAKNVTGGNGSYYYTWQESLTNSYPWQTAAGSVTETINRQYNPIEDPNATLVSTRYFRRMVISGPNEVCKDSTSGVKLIQYPKIKNNIIKTESGGIISGPLCQEGSSLLKFSGTAPQGGNGTYTYKWLAGSSNQALLPTGKTQESYEGPAPDDFLTYSRVVTDGSGLCIDSTSSRIGSNQYVQVFRIPIAIAGIDADICGGTVLLRATLTIGGDNGTGWEFQGNPLIKAYSDPAKTIVTVKVDTAFFSNKKNQEVEFSWKEKNGVCFDTNTVKINFFTRVKELGPDRDTSFYTFSDIIHLDADPYLTWETGLWTTIAGSDNFDDHAKPDAMIDDLFEGLNSYKWTVSNKNTAGAAICSDSYLYNINDIDIFIPNAFSPNGDGLYDKFIVKGLDANNQEAELRIVNSAGTEVFYTTNREGKVWVDWDGRNTKGNELPEGTYYYLMRLIDNDNNSEVYKKQGFVVLKRYGQVD